MSGSECSVGAGNKGLFKQLPHSLALVKDLQNQSSPNSKAKVSSLCISAFRKRGACDFGWKFPFLEGMAANSVLHAHRKYWNAHARACLSLPLCFKLTALELNLQLKCTGCTLCMQHFMEAPCNTQYALGEKLTLTSSTFLLYPFTKVTVPTLGRWKGCSTTTSVWGWMRKQPMASTT